LASVLRSASFSYGERGYVAIAEALQDLFPIDEIEDIRTTPLEPTDFLRRVLIPEATVLLIMEDLNETRSQAIKTMHDSRSYGSAMYPLKDNEADLSFSVDPSLQSLSLRTDSRSTGSNEQTSVMVCPSSFQSSLEPNPFQSSDLTEREAGLRLEPIRDSKSVRRDITLLGSRVSSP
jgi:hypothetical protein